MDKTRAISLISFVLLNCGLNVVATVTANRTCTFNPCSWMKDFCLNGGLCSLNPITCVAECKCMSGFGGDKCQDKLHEKLSNSSSKATLSPLLPTTERGTDFKGANCALDPCTVSEYCENNGKCSLDTESCTAQCECPNGFSGSRCQNVAGVANDSSLPTRVSQFCTFNPCIGMANFCLNNGSCSIDSSTCIATCACPHGYRGNRCQHHLNESDKSSTTEKPRVCAFNPCTWSSSYCQNDGVCKLDTSTCLAYCTCKEGFSGARCETDVGTDSTPSVTPTTSERICAFDVCSWSKDFCQNNGTCFLDKVTCIAQCKCGDNFFGKRCESSLSTTVATTTRGTTKDSCNLNLCSMSFTRHCFNDGECKFDQATCKATCECKENYTGTRCEAKISVEETGEESANDTVTESPVDQAYNICRDDALERTEEERKCNAAFQCVYGVCKVTYESGKRFTGYGHKCECDPGAKGTFCEEKCCRDCGPHGQCRMHKSLVGLTEGCICNHRWDGEFCEIYVPEPIRVEYEENTWYLWVVGLCVGTFVVLLLLAVIAPYWMWTHRVILIMKIVHYFQAYEDEDDKEYDAFVSYKADETDERFVVQVLYPKLEKELGFKLCLHFRDFVPGETISNNIINAVEGSRRTILILTPRYIKSEFTRFEYQKAQEEMLKRKHRIIPVVLEDISECKQTMDKNLKGIIGSVTYLEWPGADSENKNEKFWKRLQLSMPKKKVLEQVSSEKSFGSGQTDSTQVSGNVYSSGYEIDNQNIYTEIGEIDETLSPTIRPLSETEELALVSSSDRILDTSHSKEPDWSEKDSERITKFNNSQSNLRNNLMMVSLNELKLDLKENIKSKECSTINLDEGDNALTPSEYIV